MDSPPPAPEQNNTPPTPAPAPTPEIIPAAPAPIPQFTDIPQDAKTMALLAHLISIVAGFWAPLLIFLIKKDEHPYIADQSKEALNFQITFFIAMFISAVLIAACYIGLLLMPVVAVGDIVFCILAAMAANKGETYRYPVCIRIIK